nr:hypothetical protein [Tanacetum cinerariifolium]
MLLQEAFEIEAVDKWKKALSVAADLSGFDLQEMTNGYESKFIDIISKEILKVISDGPLDVVENLVTVDARVRELNLLRFVGSDKVHMIGICGFSGIGKTTLAKAIYNSMYTYFEGRCFCEDVQGVTKRQGLTQVQMQMFVKILKTENLKISSVSEGTKVIKQSMAYIRRPTKDFEEFAFKIVKYFARLPFGSKVIGRSLYGKSVHFWKSELDRLQTYPNSQIEQKLRPSFDSLASDQKRMFLDIACVLIGENKDFAASVLDISNCFANAIIEVLVDKSLITVSPSNMSLQMHELIQSMSREIVREKFDMHVNRIEGLWKPFAVNFPGSLVFLSDELRLFYWHGCPFKYLPSDFNPQNIVAIDLSYGQIKQIWKTPKITNLKELSLEGCVDLVSLHPSIGIIKRLVVLNLRDCKRLQYFPSIVEMDALQDLNLSGCLDITNCVEPFGLDGGSFYNLLEVPESIGGLSCLKVLNLGGNNFTSLSGSLSQLSHLEELNVDGCKKLEVLPELPPSIWDFNASHCTSLREVSRSFKDPLRKRFKAFSNCPKLFKNDTIGGYFLRVFKEFLKNEVIGIQDSYMIWLQYTRVTWNWKEAKNFVTFCFKEDNEDIEVKECGARVVCDGDLHQDVTNLSMFEDLSTHHNMVGELACWGLVDVAAGPGSPITKAFVILIC